MQRKTDLRLAIKDRLSHLTAKDRDIESRVICRELATLLGSAPRILAAYMPYTDEPNITPLIQTLMNEGWTIVMPAVEHNRLVFRHVTDLTQNRKNPTSGIIEAVPECPIVNDALIVDAIVPGRSFTRQGERMGRGNGGYDIWIAHQRNMKAKTRFIGVCFECQILADIPMEPHDQRVDMVITSRGVLRP